jgi:hypothetical protein
MLRRVILIVVAAVFGVLTTVGIAWWFACREVVLSSAYLIEPPGPRVVEPVAEGTPGMPWAKTAVSLEVARSRGTQLWEMTLHDVKGLPESYVTRGALRVPDWVREAVMPWERGNWQGRTRIRMAMLARGWPVVTMWSEVVHRAKGRVDSGGLYLERYLRRLGYPSHLTIHPMASSYDAPLPMWPVWPNFAMSSLAWGVVWWAAWWGAARGLRAQRRRWRRRKGLCTACGYDRRGLEAGVGCPECGGRF